LRIYGLQIAELFTALLIFFAREHQSFRWTVSPIQSLVCQVLLVLVNVYMMVRVMGDYYCLKTDTCSPSQSENTLMILYIQYVISMYLEALGSFLIASLSMSLGWCHNRRFPRELNLEKYSIERPKKTSIYDLFANVAVYQPKETNS